MDTVGTKGNLIEEFNSFFKGRAEIVINGDRLEITINGATLIISFPKVIGAQSTDLS